jgi:hypothetical protein
VEKANWLKMLSSKEIRSFFNPEYHIAFSDGRSLLDDIIKQPGWLVILLLLIQ